MSMGIQYPVSWRYLKRLATPPLMDRLRQWLIGREAA